ncbi:MAG: FkbM family methyltransferase [Clostridia bacterium]|nr:FkbM family methyltransferase [Clostridia bacterium]
MTDIWTYLKSVPRPILLYGTGNGADKILNELNRLEIKISGVFASDGFVRTRTFRGFRVMSLKEAEALFGDFVALFSFGSARAEVIENVKAIMQSHEILAPEVPVIEGEIFNIEYAKRHEKELYEVYSILADEQSKKVFRETVLFKLDGNINRLFSCQTDEDEAFDNILKLKKGDSFLDLGAYSGDTVLDFVKRVENFGHITAVEPDRKSYSKLLKNTEGLEIERINAAISSKCGEIPFSFKSSRGSGKGGEDKITALTVDSLSSDRRFDYIKFDVEGCEFEAILGAVKTIKKDKPKMLVSAYHKSDDYFTIPKRVLEINPDYKVYMRHYPYIPAWDTNFYFI